METHEMTRIPLITATLILTLSANLYAGTYEWTEGYGMGVTEYLVDDGNENSLVISCPPDSEEGISAYAHIQGKDYSSKDIDSPNGSFDVIVDGKEFSNPFYTNCHACGDIFRSTFWPALRNANRLQVSVEGKIFNLPVRNLKKLLKPLDHPENTCTSAW